MKNSNGELITPKIMTIIKKLFVMFVAFLIIKWHLFSHHFINYLRINLITAYTIAAKIAMRTAFIMIV
ncbi:hypothetical protein LDI01_21030 [Lentilactobacillus diolivorans]|uniref:Uncharacterized protein n=1 Tax=Lentilactobacillus diolivorans TaxID=179838 RepID=A0ABQ0XM69_9LACO|nr:hypothetical protein LDI01_21030 [Lentilactobacillus diolivorans]